MLTKNQLKQLRNEITLNSLFTLDYENTLYIKPKTAQAFFDGFMEYICDSEPSTLDVIDIIKKHDNINELYNYYLMFSSDPLLQDDYIASKHINNYDGIVIYDVVYGIENKVKTAYIYNNGIGDVFNTKITINKLYSLDGRFYFIKNKQKYFVDDFVRVNI